MAYCIYHLIHIQTPYQYIPKLVITNVPDDVTESEIRNLAERAGYEFEEFGIPWANHDIELVDVKESPANLICRLRRGEGERITYDELCSRAEAPIV